MCFSYIFLLILPMKNFLKTIGTLSLALLITACSDTSNPTEAEKNMAEMMGISVEELRNQTPEEHMKMMQQMNQDDHHQGEENVEPHDHDESGANIDDHHAGEENVEPHGHDDQVAPKPPSRSNAGDDHDDAGTEPHGH